MPRPLSTIVGPSCPSCGAGMRPNGSMKGRKKWRCAQCGKTATDPSAYRRGEIGRGRPKP